MVLMTILKTVLMIPPNAWPLLTTHTQSSPHIPTCRHEIRINLDISATTTTASFGHRFSKKNQNTHRSIEPGSRLTITFRLLFSGRNLRGMDSHVFRPMITELLRVVFVVEGEEEEEDPVVATIDPDEKSVRIRYSRRDGRGADAPLAKYFISPGNFQGRPPLIPIPMDWVAATMMVSLGVGGGIVEFLQGGWVSR
jgi:hypothetical protein